MPIESDLAAVEVASALAATFARTASERDGGRRLPLAELDLLSDAGLFGLTVPKAFGGPDVNVVTLVEVFRLLAQADPSVGQIPHSHFVFLEVLRLQGTAEQQAFFFAEALAGRRFANAQSERASRTIVEDATALLRDEEGYRLSGEKFYATGSLTAHWLAVRASLPGSPIAANGLPIKAIAYLRADTAGVSIEDDWNGIGQRTTASGTVRFSDVHVSESAVVPYTPIFDRPTSYGSFAQVLHAALDAGIARAAVDAAVVQVRQARAWFESGADRASDDSLLVQQAGELEIVVRGAEALLAVAADAVQVARLDPTEQSTASASIATATAKVACARAAVEASSALFELGGTRSAASALNLDRFWRDARTHTLHDPTRWKVQHVGRWLLNGTPPPRHGLL
ncbi:SfnB family sulfur acquisition oxidoreductase [Dactylosporangium sp. NPDC051484]|uniref:SfnB family sulfur acquisition oxidoreductase n=1 Tax=Dactylosporangium sp. NPDC051484 TaxID=3154942 RepID=UPI00344D9F78